MTEGERLEALVAHAEKRLQRATDKAKAARDELNAAGDALGTAAANFLAWCEANPHPPDKLF